MLNVVEPAMASKARKSDIIGFLIHLSDGRLFEDSGELPRKEC